MSKNSTLGLSPDRLARLLGITLTSEHYDEDENIDHSASRLMQAHLAGTLPLDTKVIDELPAIIGRLRKDLIPYAEKTLGEVLTNPKSDLDIIKRVRRYAKRMAARKNTKAKHAVAIAIYFTAIANALIYHNVKITTHSYQSLKSSFDNLANKSWMPIELTRLLVKASKICRRKQA